MSDWLDPEWRAEADGWIGEQLGRLELEPIGAFDQVHDRPWSAVIRVPTRSGSVFFKAVAPPLRHEAALTELLGSRRPDCIPPPLAVDRGRGWLLMEDGGQTMRDLIERERDLRRWLDVLPLYASVQIDLAADMTELLELGVPDLRLEVLPAKVEEVLDEIVELPDEERRRMAGRAALGSRGMRSARCGGNPGDDPARRPSRRPGLRSRRPLSAPRLG